MDSEHWKHRLAIGIAERLDSTPGPVLINGGRPEKFGDLVPSSGRAGTGLDRGSPAVAGVHRGRTVSVTLHRGSEMKLTIHCVSPCRFRIVRNTLASRLNILAGRRVRFSVPMIDAEYVARNRCSCDLGEFLQRSDTASLVDCFRPFYSISGAPGYLYVIADYSEDTDPMDIIGKLEKAIEFCGMLEEAFADETAIAAMERKKAEGIKEVGE